MFNKYTYTRTRRQFGRQCLFADRTELLASIAPKSDLSMQYILKNPVDNSTQLSKQKSYNYVITDNVTVEHRGLLHSEGGWPKDVNALDEEQTTRLRKKIERDDSWGIQVMDLCKRATAAISQNSAVNIYEDYFNDMDTLNIHDTYTARSINTFHDPKHPGRIITNIDWSPGDLNRLLAVYSSTEYFPISLRKEDENSFYIWDIDNPLKPLMEIMSPEIAKKALYCPRDKNLIAGGLISGKTCIWDARIGGHPIAITPLEAAHRSAVSALCWVHSKSNTEFYTGSVDGSILYWDCRNLKESSMNFLLDPEPTDDQLRSRSHGASVLEFEYTIPVRYIIGTDQGYVFIGNRKGITPMETFLGNYKIFSGPIRTIERNPFFVKNFLIVGDWCAKMWSEENKDFPTTFFMKEKNQITCGTWSTTRCSLFVTGDLKGFLDFWDLLMNQKEPIYRIDLKHPITSIKFREDGEFIAASLANGNIILLELDDAMRKSAAKDRALLSSVSR